MSCIIIIFLSVTPLPLDSWQNDFLEEQMVRGIKVTAFPSLRPFDLKESDDFVAVKVPNLLFDYKYDTLKVLRMKPALYYEKKFFTLHLEPVVKFGDDSLPPNNKFMDIFCSDYERAFASVQGRFFKLFAGRERFSVGPSPRYNLLLSGYSAPMDWLAYSLGDKKLKLSLFISRISDMHCKEIEYQGDTITNYIDAIRYLSIKRLDLNFIKGLNIGINEGALFGGENYILETYHFNPVVFLQAYQYNWGKDINFFQAFDAKYFGRNFTVYAQWLLDDFQLEPDPNNEPNHWGFNCGIELADPLKLSRTFWQFEYTAVSRFTYCHFWPYQRYSHQNTAIGHPYGPDFDEFFVRVLYHHKPRISSYFQCDYMRKGENNVNSLWPIPEFPRVPGTSFPADNFLAGILQSSMTPAIGLRSNIMNSIATDIQIGYFFCRNYQNQSGNEKRSLMFRLRLDFVIL